MSQQIGELMDFLAYAHILFLESKPDFEQSAHDKKFGITPQIGNAARAQAYADAHEIEQVFSLYAGSTLGLLCEILDRTRDERALPLLSRMYFFYGPIYMMGNDSWYSDPGWIAHDSFRSLLYSVRRDLWEQMPKMKSTMDSSVYLDSVRVWILERKQSLLPSGIPVGANIQEAPFQQFLANEKLQHTAHATKPADPFKPADPSKPRYVTLIIIIAGLTLLTVRTTKNREKR